MSFEEDILKKINREFTEERDPSDYEHNAPITGKLNVKDIPFLEINPSTANNDLRSMDDDDLRILADSIKEFGIKEPLRVYEEHELDYKYKIISGHRRIAAWQMLVKDDKFNPRSTLPCIIVEKPADEISEKIDVAQSNISRRKPKDLVREVNIANDIWQKIIAEGRQEDYKEKLLSNFRRRYATNDKYNANPKRFERYHYRSRIEFIRAITGLEWTNNTVNHALKKTVTGDVPDSEGNLEEDPEEVAEKEAAKAEKKVSKQRINKQLTKLIELLNQYCNQTEVDVEVNSKIADFEDFRNTYFPEETKTRKKKSKNETITDENVDSLF